MVWMNKAFRIRIVHGTLLVLNHDDVTWGCPKGGDLGKRLSFLDKILGSKNSCRYFVVKNHKIYFVVLISFPYNMEFHCNSKGVFSKT
jgi:hypothetical protein